MDNHITLDQLDQAVWSLVQKINSKEIPENVSELNNDAEYITIDQVPTYHIPEYMSELINDEGYLTIYSTAINNYPIGYIHNFGSSTYRLVLGNAVKYSSNSNSINEFIFIKYGNINSSDTYFYNIRSERLVYLSTSTYERHEITGLYLDGVNTNDLYFRNVPAGIYLATLTDGRLDLTTYATQSYVDSAISSLTAADIGALPSSTVIPTVPTNVSAFTNDAGYLTGAEISYPVTSVNGDTGAVTIDEIQTTAGENNVEYDLIGTAPANTNSGLVPLYKPTLLTFAKTTDYGRLTLGSSDTPGVLRIYSSTTNASGYTDLKTSSSSTNTRTITFPDATGTVALTSDIPSVSSWALAANKPSYTFSELTSHPTSIGGYGITDAYTKTEVDGMVSGVLHYKGTKATVSALPSSGNTTGDTWHVTADGSEWAWDGSDWQELGTAVDLSGYVPTSRTVNGKALSSDISLTASDVSALPSSTTYVSSFNGESGAITYTAPVTSVNGQTGAVTIAADDKTWNGVSLVKTIYANNTNYYLPFLTSSSATQASLVSASAFPTAKTIAVFDENAYLKSTTPSANDNSTKVATTAYVDAAIPSVPSWALASSKPTYTASEVGAVADTAPAAAITSTDISNWNALVSDDKTWNGVALTTTETQSNGAQYIPIFQSKQLSGNASMLTVTSTPTAYKITKYDENAYLKSTTPTSGDSSTKVATTAFVGTAIAAITASDVGALADDSVAAGITSTDISNWNAKLSSFTETDPTVPSWAKQSSKPTYTASEVGAVPSSKRGSTFYSTISNNASSISLISNDDTFGYSSFNMSGGTTTLSADSITLKTNNINNVVLSGGNTTIIGVVTPTTDDMAANKAYVDNKVSAITASDVGALPSTTTYVSSFNGSTGAITYTAPVTSVNGSTGAVTISIPQHYNASTNPTGYLTISDLPIYDGTVV